jgi:hypothetical protein
MQRHATITHSRARMQLSIDHLIIRSATPEKTLAELAARAGAPVLAPVEEVGGLASGIVRAGPVDIEVVRIGADPPPEPQGYGLGLVADVRFAEAVAGLRALGIATSAAPRVTAGEGARRRSWRAAQLRGLLPDPFPVPASTRPPGGADRAIEALSGALLRIPAVARAAMRRAGGSMVVLTEYGFDADAWRASAGGGGGPSVVAVRLGTGGHRAAWERLPRAGRPALQLDDEGPAGIRRVELAGAPPAGGAGEFSIGSVEFAFAGR